MSALARQVQEIVVVGTRRKRVPRYICLGCKGCKAQYMHESLAEPRTCE